MGIFINVVLPSILILLVLILMLGPVIFRRIEKREFNKGFCTECGEHMQHFDVDSSGADGWCCNRCGRVIWICWLNTSKELVKTDENGDIC